MRVGSGLGSGSGSALKVLESMMAGAGLSTGLGRAVAADHKAKPAASTRRILRVDLLRRQTLYGKSTQFSCWNLFKIQVPRDGLQSGRYIVYKVQLDAD